MTFRIVSPDEENKDCEEDKVSYLSDTAKLMILLFIMCFIPLFAYDTAVNYWGTRVGTHVGVITGACCTLLTCFLSYFADFMEQPKSEK